jgi:ATP-dependent helicase HrpA
VAPGVCIRLYSEEDLAARPEFTEPEILRTNLASVILQMTAIGLGDVGAFPFLEPPEAASIRDGYLLLEELGAIEPVRKDGRRIERPLTKVGRRLARLPVDPRLGRMVLEAGRLGCVREVLVIAAALSMQDVRERPTDRRERADELHRRFDVAGSDLLSIVALWNHLRTQQRALSGNRFRRLCRDEYINYLRVREWVDLYSQLRRVAGDLGLRPHRADARPDDVHRAVLAGLLSHVGVRDRRTRDYQGARNARFVIAGGSVLTGRPPEWVMAAELVETNRLYARRVAAIEPEWAERVGAHLVKRASGDPRWDVEGGRAIVTERVTLYGLPLVTDRVIGYDRVDEAAARAWFITKALVEGEVPVAWSSRHDFVARNADYLERTRRLSARVRRTELFDDDALFEFYDERVLDDVTSTRRFDRWWQDAGEPHLLDLTDDILERGRHDGVRLDEHPDMWRQGDIELPLTYRFAPGEPLDGVTVHIPLAALNQVRDEGFDWQVPGLRRDLVDELVRSLPKSVRRGLIPLGDTIDGAFARLGGPTPGRSLTEALAVALTDVSGVEVRAGQFDRGVLSDHLRMHFVISDSEGEVRDVGTDLAEIKRRLAHTVRDSIAAATSLDERRGITAWDVGDLPKVVEVADAGLGVRGYPTLLDVGDSVALRVVSAPELQQRAMRGGVRLLLILGAAPSRASAERLLTSAGRLAVADADIEVATLIDDCIAAAVDAAIDGHALPWTEQEFVDLRAEVRRVSPALTRTALTKAVTIVAAAVRVQATLAALRATALAESIADANAHLGRLVRAGFVLDAGIDRLDDIERYVGGIAYRLDHLAGAVERDRRRIEEVIALEARYDRIVAALDPATATADVAELRWSLEELRISTFAQPLGTKGHVSVKRIRQRLAALSPTSSR